MPHSNGGNYEKKRTDGVGSPRFMKKVGKKEEIPRTDRGVPRLEKGRLTPRNRVSRAMRFHIIKPDESRIARDI